MAFLELREIRKQYGESIAVERCDLGVERGEFVSLLGPSGCGKTTTLRMIAGFETPSNGTITIDGVNVTNVAPSRRNIGMVFQSYALFPNMTVAENIGFGMKIAGRAAAEIRTRVSELLQLISLPELGERYPHQLSGGQQQRVALARALAIQPKLLLLDEPLSALDAKIRVSLRSEIRAIQQKLGITTIYVTHDQEEAMSLSDRIVVMSQGHIEQIGAPYEIYNYPRTRFVASFVGTLNLLSAQVVDAQTKRVSIDGQDLLLAEPVSAGNGASLAIALRPEAIAPGEHAEHPNRLRGSVDDVTYLGPVVRVRLQLGEQRLWFDQFNQPGLRLPTRGEDVTVSFAPTACLVLHESSG